MTKTMKVYEVLARALAQAEVGTLFGVTGDANVYLIDCFVRAHAGRFVAAANENGAALMALGYASVSGKVGFATVTHGPAVTNTLTALVEGVKAGTPMVLICGDTAHGDRQNLQNIPQRDVIVGTGAGFEQLNKPETAVDDLARAIRRAQAERRPVAFNLPADLMWRSVDADLPSMLVSMSKPVVVPSNLFCRTWEMRSAVAMRPTINGRFAVKRLSGIGTPRTIGMLAVLMPRFAR